MSAPTKIIRATVDQVVDCRWEGSELDGMFFVIRRMKPDISTLEIRLDPVEVDTLIQGAMGKIK